jgi:hypothetical protein
MQLLERAEANPSVVPEVGSIFLRNADNLRAYVGYPQQITAEIAYAFPKFCSCLLACLLSLGLAWKPRSFAVVFRFLNELPQKSKAWEVYFTVTTFALCFRSIVGTLSPVAISLRYCQNFLREKYAFLRANGVSEDIVTLLCRPCRQPVSHSSSLSKCRYRPLVPLAPSRSCRPVAHHSCSQIVYVQLLEHLSSEYPQADSITQSLAKLREILDLLGKSKLVRTSFAACLLLLFMDMLDIFFIYVFCHEGRGLAHNRYSFLVIRTLNLSNSRNWRSSAYCKNRYFVLEPNFGSFYVALLLI